jgi:ATP-dependent Zn protease
MLGKCSTRPNPSTSCDTHAFMKDTPSGLWAHWEPCTDGQDAAALARLAAELPQFFGDSTVIGSRCSRLTFYKVHQLLELKFVRNHASDVECAFALDGPVGTLWLNGEADSIHRTNEAESLALTDSTAADYLRFFLYFLRSDEGAFVPVEVGDQIRPGDEDDEPTEDDSPPLTLEAARSKVHPLQLKGRNGEGHWLFGATVAYSKVLFETKFEVEPNGLVEMVDDNPVGLLSGLTFDQPPSLSIDARQGDWPENAAAQPSDRQVTEAVVTVLLEDALREQGSDTKAGYALLRHFNSRTKADKPIEQLARLMVESRPMIVIESDVPFVEDVVAQLAASHGSGGLPVVRASAVAGDDLRCEITVNDYGKLYLLSFHTYRSVFDAERVANELALSDAAVLIGCAGVNDVPEPLRRAADLVLTFPRIDRQRFARIFEGVFDVKPTAGWDAEGADWTRYLVPGDFHTPRRLALGPDDALAMLRDRVEARLSAVTPDSGPGMDSLHGLGEARQIAEDLIDDIRAAQAGQIPWSVVDRGLLLVGSPGTGKTTLARAIAKECAVKFVVASASNWQSAGALDAHLRAMRGDFAEARRYAPAILFIDEIDSIGNREELTGPNAQYQTEVINSLLEQIQGIDSTDTVIVVGATNYLDKVDPALRRAGRLDQVVEIPRPNIEGLEQIFAYYLSRFEAEGGALGTIDTRAAAELALGLTAADVEFFVRGAARRARRDNKPLGQDHLLAEVTRRPRHPDSAPRLTPAAMHRVAVHEAGHTVARLVSSTLGADLTFVSIIPRLDGTLGFTAAVPDTTRVLTRRTMLEQLETMLAGRAAEEIVFGADDIGAGAGGPSTASDLAVATRLATLIVCQSGLSDDGFLRWTTEPTSSQESRIDEILHGSYARVRQRLQTCRPLLDNVVTALEDKQELSGSELRRLAESVKGA